jgi:cytochrome c556
MTRLFTCNAILCLGLGLAACAGRAFHPSETIQDIMVHRVAPAAGVLWGAVGLESTSTGTVEHALRTDADWNAVRTGITALLEAADLLAVPRRRVAAPGRVLADANTPGNLTAAEIQTGVDADQDGFAARARALHDAGLTALAAVRARNVEKLAEAGETVNNTCASCHSAYWYPDSIQPVQ